MNDFARHRHPKIGRSLPGRTNIVVTRDPEVRTAGVLIAPDLEAAFSMARSLGEVMVIGGATLYAEALPHAERIYTSRGHNLRPG